MKNVFVNVLVVAFCLLAATVFSRGCWNYASAQKEITRRNAATDAEIEEILYKYGFNIGALDKPTPIDYLTAAIKH